MKQSLSGLQKIILPQGCRCETPGFSAWHVQPPVAAQVKATVYDAQDVLGLLLLAHPPDLTVVRALMASTKSELGREERNLEKLQDLVDNPVKGVFDNYAPHVTFGLAALCISVTCLAFGCLCIRWLKRKWVGRRLKREAEILKAQGLEEVKAQVGILNRLLPRPADR